MKAKTKTRQFSCWGISYKFDYGRSLLGSYCWEAPVNLAEVHGIRTAIFRTRKQARKAQKTCCYKKTRIERLCVTVEAIGDDI